MNRRMFIRYFSLLWASLQLAMPGLSAVADGMLARESAANPATHVEATTSSSCPVVHSPDCAVCRYLSVSASADSGAPLFGWAETSQRRLVQEGTTLGLSSATVFPPGRAPPTL